MSYGNLLVKRWRDLFVETGNPIYAWRAYDTARKFSRHGQEVAIPEEVLRYFDTVAAGVLKVAKNPPKPSKRPPALAKALGLQKRVAGQGSYFDDYAKRRQDRRIALDMAAEVREYQGVEDYPLENIANKYGLSKYKVRRIYHDYRNRWREAAKQIQFDSNGRAKVHAAGYAEDLREMACIMEIAETMQKGDSIK